VTKLKTPRQLRRAVGRILKRAERQKAERELLATVMRAFKAGQRLPIDVWELALRVNQMRSA
jgi:ribosomal protein L21E